MSASPRAFATATGVVFQFVGIVYFLGGAAYWFVSGRVQEAAAVRVDHVRDYFDQANACLTVTTLNVLCAVVGGLAMVAVGIGLQGEKRRAGAAAMWTAGLMGMISLASAVLYIVFGPAWFRAAVVVLFALVHATLFLLAGHSAAILKRFPPQNDLNAVDGAWLEEYERTRGAARRQGPTNRE